MITNIASRLSKNYRGKISLLSNESAKDTSRNGLMPLTAHKVKDNSFKLILHEPDLFAEFLRDFIPVEILKDVSPSDIEDITERFLPLFDENKDSDTVKRISLN